MPSSYNTAKMVTLPLYSHRKNIYLCSGTWTDEEGIMVGATCIFVGKDSDIKIFIILILDIALQVDP